MILNSLPIISLILTLVLIIVLISFINFINSAKKLIREKSIVLPLSEEHNNMFQNNAVENNVVQNNETADRIISNKTIDPDFLDRVTSIIFREITNTNNIIEVISSELCISSSQLNRKIKLMTGMTTTNFILKTRLNRARKQLTVTQKPIGEIAMDCGFNDFAYFSRSFKKAFEMTPTTFQRLTHSLN